MKHYIVIFFALLFVPLSVQIFAYADVQITEVAWMGTTESQYSEWVELYNDGSTEVNLAGWKLYEGSGTVVFTLTKSIGANGYLLIERTTASAPDPVPGINDEAGPFGAGGFANTGEDLILKDTGGAAVETLSFASGWPAGDSTTKATMQWDGSTWITAAATPKAATSGSDEGSPTSTTTETLVDEAKDPYPIPPISPNQPHIEFVTPATVYTGMSYEYKARPVFEYKHAIDNGNFYWNMGDGTILRQHSFEPLAHTYQYAGTYVISFRYDDPVNTNNILTGTKKITVVTPACTIVVINNKALQIKNTTSGTIDLSGWTVSTPRARVAIPDMTILAEKATITIPFSILSIEDTAHITLVDPSGSIVASTDPATVAVAEEITYASPDDAPYEAPDLSDAFVAHAEESEKDAAPIRNRTKTIIFGAITLFVIGLSILLERFMARQEYL